MTCYFRHMKDSFLELGIEVTPDNKKEIDRIIHELVGVEYKNCSQTWKAIKVKRAADEEFFMKQLGAALSSFQ